MDENEVPEKIGQVAGLDHLFRTAHPKDRGPDTPAEVADHCSDVAAACNRAPIRVDGTLLPLAPTLWYWVQSNRYSVPKVLILLTASIASIASIDTPLGRPVLAETLPPLLTRTRGTTTLGAALTTLAAQVSQLAAGLLPGAWRLAARGTVRLRTGRHAAV